MFMQVGIAAYSGIPPDIERHVERAKRLVKALKQYCGSDATLVLGGYRGLMKLIVDEALREGLRVVLVLPRDYEGVDEPKGAVIIRTGMDSKARSAILVRSSDVLIVFGGASGTMVEALMAYGIGIPVVYLVRTGLLSDKLRVAYPDGVLDERIGPGITYVEDEEEAARIACARARQGVRSSPS